MSDVSEHDSDSDTEVCKKSNDAVGKTQPEQPLAQHVNGKH